MGSISGTAEEEGENNIYREVMKPNMDIVTLLSHALGGRSNLFLKEKNQKQKDLRPEYRMGSNHVITWLNPSKNMASVVSSKQAPDRLSSVQLFNELHRHKSNKTHGTLFKILRLNDIKIFSDIQITIKNVKFLASYNWVKTEMPTVFVPGAPGLWRYRKLPITVEKDRLLSSRGKNEKLVPAPPYAPLFGALLTMQPTYSLLSVALVTDRNSLRKLFDFASGNPRQDWRIYTELVNGTLFLIRRDVDKGRAMVGSSNPGYGHSIEEKFVRFGKDIENSSRHHRIIEYDIGGMKWVVRFEADGYYKTVSKSKEVITELSPGGTGDGVSKSETDITTTTTSAGLPILNAICGSDDMGGVTVIEKGKLVPPESIIEIKSKNGRPKSGSQLDIDKVSQCWFSQTKTIFLVRHQDGSVDSKPVRIDLSDKFELWEKKQQAQLGKLINIVKEITALASRVDGGRCCLYCNHSEKPSTIRVFRSAEDNLKLSSKTRETFWKE